MTVQHSHLRVLLTGPNEPLLRLVRLALQLDGWMCEIALSDEALFAHLDQGDWDLIIQDVTILRQRAVQAARAVRKRTATPLLLLIQREQRQQQREVISEGADGYLSIPFSLEDLVEQVRLLFGVESEPAPVFTPDSLASTTIVSLPGKKMAGRVWQEGQEIQLTPIEVRVLFALVQHSGQVMRSETLLSQIWGTAYRYETPLLAAYMQRLRAKLEDDPVHPRYLRSPSEGEYVFTP